MNNEIKNGNDIILWDGEFQIEFINEDMLNKNFDYGYCRTLYSVEGESLKSFYFCEEDLNNFFITGRMAYTLISRLKTK